MRHIVRDCENTHTMGKHSKKGSIMRRIPREPASLGPLSLSRARHFLACRRAPARARIQALASPTSENRNRREWKFSERLQRRQQGRAAIRSSGMTPRALLVRRQRISIADLASPGPWRGQQQRFTSLGPAALTPPGPGFSRLARPIPRLVRAAARLQVAHSRHGRGE